jgi:hypothetical protein
MSSPFETATAISRAETTNADHDDDQERLFFKGNIPDSWQQGKGAFGGVVVGLMTRAMVAVEQQDDPSGARRLRSLTADLCAPALTGPVEIGVRRLRRGGSMTFLEASLRQNGSLVARSSSLIGSSRNNVTPPAIRATPPPKTIRPPWNDVPISPVGPPIAPIFTHHYEYRSTGPLPFAGGADPIAAGWVWEKSRATRLDEAAVVALLDSWWPATFAIESAPRPVTTVGYTMQLLVDPKTIPLDRPVFYQAKGVASGENFFVEMREIWDGDRIIGMNQQTFAVLA